MSAGHRHRKGPARKLYWVYAPDHEDDWFVVARSLHIARQFFASFLARDLITVGARYVARLPECLQQREGIGFPDNFTLAACGGVLFRPQEPRIVSFDGVMYHEGSVKRAPASTSEQKAPLRARR